MKNTVKLEQFKEVTEAELQEIRGGDKRGLMDLFKQIPIFRRK
ncbi:competence-stimulating peptide ComC [Streptococcus oralis]|uniref:Competence-stimulating peptide, CSP n=1 Tax=Streptococcus oralis TaxID=1303 RepID=A0A139M7G0_STROR|nr:competence-stimulating peptide ComC [Streptococcus oralis]KXT59582.1 competence-stimulating peptide, CSP [Streptococcus oralis]UJD02971.1 competence-stimulating peptide ComC [Streptococcus oralis]